MQTLNREWRVSIARIEHPRRDTLPLVLLHSPGKAYAFDSNNTGPDTAEAGMRMLTALDLHLLDDPHVAAPRSYDWNVQMDRPGAHSRRRPSRLTGPKQIEPISPLSREPIPAFWRDLVHRTGGWAQLMFVAGVDFAMVFPDEYPQEMSHAAHHRWVAGATVRVFG